MGERLPQPSKPFQGGGEEGRPSCTETLQPPRSVGSPFSSARHRWEGAPLGSVDSVCPSELVQVGLGGDVTAVRRAKRTQDRTFIAEPKTPTREPGRSPGARWGVRDTAALTPTVGTGLAVSPAWHPSGLGVGAHPGCEAEDPGVGVEGRWVCRGAGWAEPGPRTRRGPGCTLVTEG